MVIGSLTKFGTTSFAIRFFLGKIKSEEWVNKPFAYFDTENPENLEKKEWSAAEKIAEKLREKKMNQLLPVLRDLVLGQKDRFKKAKSNEQKIMQKNLQSN